MVKILFVVSGTRIVPASRYRVYQLLPFFEKEGIERRVCSVISQKTSEWMIGSPRLGNFMKTVYYLGAFAERTARMFMIILMAGHFDLVFLQRAAFGFGMERLLRLVNKNIIFDMDDSIYTSDSEESGPIAWLERRVRRRYVVSILRVSRCVIAENNHIKNFVMPYCSLVYIIPGPIDTVKNYPKQHSAGLDSGRVTIGWIGSPSTSIYLEMLNEPLSRLSKRYKIKLRLIGISSCFLKGIDTEFVKWEEGTETAELHKFDIGVMVMPDNEWTRGKLGCKMLQYMANAIPAVVSYTPTNAEVIEDGVNGFLAGSEEEWVNKLSLLIENTDIRKKIGLAGRRTIEKKFSLQTNVPRYIDIFRKTGRMVEFKKALVTGANGMLGSALCLLLKERNIKVLPADVIDAGGIYKLDIRDKQKVADFINRHKPDIVFHLAAETDVDKCELEPQHAYEVNSKGAENAALACRQSGIPMVYVSTAAVFNGQKTDGYVEQDEPDPINIYGKSKLEGERMVASLLKKYYIVRTSWMIGGHDKDKKFVYKIIQLLRTSQEISVVTDKAGSPTFTKHLARGLLAIAATGEFGLYHCVNTGICTRFDIAKKIAEYMKKEDVVIRPVTSDAFRLPAPRPASEGLINGRLLSMGLDIMGPWEDALKEYIKEMPQADV